MKVQTKLTTLLVFAGLILIASRFLYQSFENERMYILFRENNVEKSAYFSELIKLKSANLGALAFDYTYWDEMVDFVSTADAEWAKGNLSETVLNTYQADGVWVYDPALALVYSITSKRVSGLKDFPLEKDTIRAIFKKNRLCDFFIITEAGLMEVKGATIHPTMDAERLTEPRGYFFTGRLWTKKYLSELGKLIGGDLRISKTKEPLPGFKDLLRTNAIVFSKEFNSWDSKTLAYLYVNIRSNEIANYKKFSQNATAIFFSFLIGFILFVTGFLTRTLTIPFNIISQALKRENADNLRSLEKDSSEFGDISKLISRFFRQKEELLRENSDRQKAENSLKEAYVKLKEMQDQLIQAEKLNALGKLASGVAHEVRNPLAIIMQGVDYLETKVPATSGDVIEILGILKENVRRADKIINDLLDFSRAARLNLEAIELPQVIDDALNLVKTRFRFDKIMIIKEIKPGITKALGDKNRLEQVFVNLLLNSIQAMPQGGKITIRVYEKKLEEIRNGVGKRAQDNFYFGEKALIIEVEDTGCGIPDDNLKKIFDPFFSTKGQKGAGLGLSVTKNIINMHRGLIYADSKFGQWTKITIILKIAQG
ncbi:MAG TPA: ATP-binding protein [Candidatus Omnitrophota bacterium]|nr:ATP-binding protein [Candidatus Omnitrophota bacterium]